MKPLKKIIFAVVLMMFSWHNSVAFDNATNRQPIVNIFVENSPSMDGYMVDGNFLTILGDLITDVEVKYGGVNLFIISDPSSNSVVAESNLAKIEKKESSVFSREFQIQYSFKKNGRSGNSQLDKILSYIVNYTDSGNVSIFFSDMIFSDNKVNPQSILYGIFSKKNIDMLMYRFESLFQGTYYHEAQGYTGSNYHKKIDEKRPFFICVLSDDNTYLSSINQFESLKRKGLESSSIYFSKKLVDQKAVTKDTVLKAVTEDTVLKKGRKNNKEQLYNFTVKIDLKDLILTPDYITNVENYSISKGYSIKSVERDNSVDLSSLYKIKFSTASKPQDVHITIDKNASNWDINYSTRNDYPISENLNRTYRLDDLMSGLYSAYGFKQVANTPKPYIELNYSIKQSSTPTPIAVTILICILVTVGVVAFVIFIRNKQYKS